MQTERGSRQPDDARREPRRLRSSPATIAAGVALAFVSSSAVPAGEKPAAPTLAETRLAMAKWIETQQILAKERNEWNQAKEILQGRLELVKKEIATLEEKTEQARATVAEADAKRAELVAANDAVEALAASLGETVTRMESEVRRLYRMLPDPVQAKLQPLRQRMPEDPASTRVSVAERFQNVLGILNEVNKANNEITVSYEVHELAGGKPSEVQAIYVGLAQAYYVSAGREAGIGRPTPEGWEWEPSNGLAGEVLTALGILQGKHTPAFVPLPVDLR